MIGHKNYSSSPWKFLLCTTILITLVLLSACGTSSTNVTTTPATQTTTSISTSLTTTTTPTTSSTTTSTATQTQSNSPKYGGNLRIIYEVSPAGSIGWPAESGPGTPTSVQVCLETLLQVNSKGVFSPWLAESYKLADDLSSITFKLKQGIKFHDGSDFNAEVAKWNLDNMINAKAEPGWASVDLIDNYTIKVNLTKWSNLLLLSFADNNTPAYMVSKAAFDKNGLDYMRKNPIGTGPFKFVSFQQDTGMKFVGNADYWGKDAQGNQLPYLNELDIIYISDPVLQKNAIRTGEADMIHLADAKTASDIAALGLTTKYGITDVRGLVPDSANSDSPWANLKVREAVEYAINREGIAKAFGYGYLQAPYQTPAPASISFNPNFTYVSKYDPVKAKQLLDEAGYTGNPRFETTFIAGPGTDRDVLAAVQSNLSDVGIKVNLEFPDMGGFLATFFQGEWHDAAIFMPFPSAPSYVNGLTTFLLIGKSWLKPPELMQAIDAAQATSTPDPNLMYAIANIIAQNSLLIPVVETGEGWSFQSYVMDTGALDRGMVPYFNCASTWLNK